MVNKSYFGEEIKFVSFRRRFQSRVATVASKEVAGYVAYWHNVKATREAPQVFREYQKSGNPRVVHTKGHGLDPVHNH